MTKLTKEQALAKYGAVPCKFHNYYKYSFDFVGKAEDGAKVAFSIGGDADDIYRFQVGPDTVETLGTCEYRFAIITLNGETIYEEMSW